MSERLIYWFGWIFCGFCLLIALLLISNESLFSALIVVFFSTWACPPTFERYKRATISHGGAIAGAIVMSIATLIVAAFLDIQKKKNDEQLFSKALLCAEDADCLGNRYRVKAYQRCEPHIAQEAQNNWRWMTSSLEERFQKVKWSKKHHGRIEYATDLFKVQNDHGLWVRHCVTCDFNTKTKKVFDVDVSPGRC